MSQGVFALLAFIPIAIIFIMMVGFRWGATRAMPVAFFAALFLALVVWKTPMNRILASTVNGIGIAIQILLIVFGALAVLFTLRESGAIAATATVGLVGVERLLIWRNLVPMSKYGFTAGIIGLILIYFIVPGLL